MVKAGKTLKDPSSVQKKEHVGTGEKMKMAAALKHHVIT